MGPSAARKIKLDATLLRGSAGGSREALATLAPYVELVMDKAAKAVGLLAGVPVKASVEHLEVVSLSPLQQSEAGYQLVSPAGNMVFWFGADRGFDSVLCNYCLGGVAGPKADEDVERPPTAFERGLRNLLFEKLAGCCATAMAELSEQQDVSMSVRPRLPLRKIETAVPGFTMKVLLTFFDDACELTSSFVLADCLRLTGAAKNGIGQPVSAARELVADAPFSLDVCLRPEVMDVRHILDLRQGAVLKLGTTAATPVELQFNGQKIGLGRMGHDGERVRVRLLGENSGLPQNPTVHNLLKLVNERAVNF